MPIQSTTFLCRKIIRVEIDLIIGSLKIYLTDGYFDNNSIFQSTGSVNSIDITGDDAVAIFTMSGTTGTTMYDSLKYTLYDYLIAKNIATGTII